jgi:formylglycine-generating enzyme required for sulfatase activity
MSQRLAVAACLGSLALVAPAGARAAEDDLSLDLGGAPLDLRRVPKGTFVEGSPAGEPGREPDEAPRSVTVTHAFWIGKVPVTRGQFARFVADSRYSTEAEKGASGGFGWDAKAGALVQRKDFSWKNPGFSQKDDDPVVLVTFGDATAFTTWASRKVGRRVRLPTEAEWEYAARAGSGTPWYAAAREEEALALGWFKPNAGSSTHPVGLKKPNAFGLFDMAGNVFEWCRDVYAPYPPGEAVDPENAVGVSGEPERRVLRGGSWLRDPKKGRSAARYRNAAGARNADNGFRIVVEEEGSAPSSASSAALPSPASTRSLGADASASAVVPTPASSRGEGFSFSWPLVAAPAAAAGAVVAWVLARRKRSAPDGRGIGTRAQEDGFWVRAEGLPPGSRVRYACIVGGVEVSDVVPLDGSEETFVYTGAQPSAIRIIEVIAAPAAAPGYRMATPVTPSESALPAAPPIAPLPIIPAPPSSVTGPSAPRVPTPDPVPAVVVQQLLSEDSSFRGFPSAY